MNIAAKSKSYYSDYICSCGNTFRRNIEEKCPKCGGLCLKHFRDFKNYERYTRKEIIKNTEEEFHFKNIIADLKSYSSVNNPTNLSEYEIIVDFRKHNVEIKLNGEQISINQANCRKAMTGFEVYDLNNLLYLIARKFISNSNCGDALLYFASHPELEILYSTYKSIDMAVNCELLKGTKPHEIMGLSKPMMKMYIDFEKSSNYNFKNINTHLNTLRKFDELYKDKPDKIKAVFDFMFRIRSLDFESLYLMLNNYNYDLVRLSQYLTDDIYTYQGIDNPFDGFTILVDYINICNRMSAPIEKYPKSLKLAHDIANKNLKIVISSIEAQEFKNTVSEKEYKSLVYKGKEYQVIVPEKAEDVIDEGRKLHHCVGSYVSKIRKKETKICFMRKTDSINTPLITLEVRDGYLTQYRGNCNRAPSKEEMNFIEEYAKSKNIKIR